LISICGITILGYWAEVEVEAEVEAEAEGGRGMVTM